MRDMFTFATQKGLIFDIFDMYGVEEVFHLGNLTVHKDCRRQGLDFLFLRSAVALGV